MTCRGSRRNTNDKAVNIYEDSPEWLAQNMRSTRNFIRKWGHFVKHDSLMKPIIDPKYDIGFIIKNCNSKILEILEPWCSVVYVDESRDEDMIDNYITLEQPNTTIDLYQRVKPYDNEKNNEILVKIDGSDFDEQDFNIVQQLSAIIKDSGQVGEFQLGNVFITIVQFNEYQNELIFCPKL